MPAVRLRPIPTLFVAAILLGSPAGARGQEGADETVPGPSFEDVIGLRSVGGMEISPDGRSVVFQVRSVNWDENRYDAELHLWREGRGAIRLTRSPEGTSRSARWSPDGSWIAFLSNRNEKTQLHLIRPDGGEAAPLTDVEEGVSAFRWAPDGARIAFTATEPPDSLEKRREERYGAWSVEDETRGRTHLWVVDVVPDSIPEPRRLTGGDAFTVESFAWSPDGTRIALQHAPEPSINARSDISVLDVASGTIAPVAAGPGSESGIEWSPDGAWILYASAGADTTSDYYRNTGVWKVSASGGEAIRLAADLDESVYSYWWTPKGIFATAWRGTDRPVYRIDPETGEFRTFAETPARVWGLSFSADGETVAIDGGTPTGLDELYRTRVDDWRPEPITEMTLQVADWELGTSEVVRWASEDGAEIEGVLHRPADFDPARRYPLLVVIHGGPTGIDYPAQLRDYVYPITQWLAKGALVLRPNYRGSAGYGEAFRSLNVRNLGVGDAWDVLSGVDHVVGMGIVDTTRMGAMGWSQGGYISAFLTTTTDRFAAISVGAGISDWMTYYVNTDIHPFTRQYLKATPWADPEIYARTSPMTYVLDASTPTLIQHGENDRRVPIPNAYQLYQGLNDVGVETRLIVYKGFGHGITKPKERLAATWHNWQWFAEHLWGEEVDLPLPAADGDAEAGEEG
jgi:dipeptidyl aminopeptidase/acylaminoacyl peptidase